MTAIEAKRPTANDVRPNDVAAGRAPWPDHQAMSSELALIDDMLETYNLRLSEFCEDCDEVWEGITTSELLALDEGYPTIEQVFASESPVTVLSAEPAPLEFPEDIFDDDVVRLYAKTLVESLPHVKEDMVYGAVLFCVASGCLTHHHTKYRITDTRAGYANTWSAVSGLTGLGKSPVFDKVIEILKELEARRIERWDEQARFHRVDLDHAIGQRKALMGSAKKDGMTADLRGEIADLDAQIRDLEAKASPLPRLITSDTTPQSLVEDCVMTRGKSLCVSESGPLRGGFDKHGDGDNLNAWLESYDGKPYSESRTGGSRHADLLLTHMFVMPQPDALARFETDEASQESGLAWRCISIRSRRTKERRKLEGKRGPTADLENRFHDLLRGRLLECPPHPEYRYSEEALRAFERFGDGDDWNARWTSGGDLHAIAGYRAKLDGAMYRIGLALHILNGHGDDATIGVNTARKVLELVPYLAQEKRDIHANARRDVVESASIALMQWLLTKYNDEGNEPPAGLEFDDAGDALFSLTPIIKNDVLSSTMGDSKRSSVVDVVEHAADLGWIEFDEEPPPNWATARRCKVSLRCRGEVLAAPGTPWFVADED